MKEMTLLYGRSGFRMGFDPSRFTVIEPGEAPRGPGGEHLIDAPPLEEAARGRRVLVIVSDRTRPTGAREFMPVLLRRLGSASSVGLLFATGLHRPLDDGDKAAIVGEDVFRDYPMLDHRPDGGCTRVGETSLGNRVDIDDAVLASDLVVLTGSIGFHYFAGFSGGRKSLLPGVASADSIRFNHLLVLNREGPGRHPGVGVARMEGNPVHDDMVEAARLTGRDLYVYNTILDHRKRVSSVWMGDWQEAHRRGAAHYLDSHSVAIRETRPLAIVGCGGFPRDINMIQAHKALEFAQYALDPGGTVILLAECVEGMGHPSFFPWFRHTDLADFERRLRAGYEVYGQTAWSLLSKARRFRVICVSSLDDGDIRAMGMEPAPDLNHALGLLDAKTAAAPGYILPFGAEVLPMLEA